MPLRTRVVTLNADGTAVQGSAAVPVARYAGAYYSFDPDRGTGDILITSLGRTLLSKQNARNSDGIQELTPDQEKLVNGPVVVDVSNVQDGDQIVFTLYFDHH